MPTLWVREFTGGLDTRKDPELAPGGSLIVAQDGHITRGGAFEQRADFIKLGDFPPGATAGLARTANGLVTFGSGETPASLPPGVAYQKLPHPENRQLSRIVQATLFSAKAHVSAEFSDGSRYQYNNGSRVTLGSIAAKPGPLLTYGTREYVGDDNFLRLSVLGDAADYRITDVDPGTFPAGGAFFDMATESEGAEVLTALARYNNLVAVFSEKTIQTWFFDPDPALARESQVLNNTGTIATRSVTPFGDNDVFYLDSYGVRSLRARDSSNSAATTDIGSAIDPLVIAHIQALGTDLTSRAIGLIEPGDGRMWMILGDTIYVFSYFTGSKVSAWTTYKPGFTITDAVIHEKRVYLRAGDELWVYGSEPDMPYQYSEGVHAEAWLPYLDADLPAREKDLEAIDASVRGQWDVRVAYDPKDLTISDALCEIDATTFGHEAIPLGISANYVSLRFKAKAPQSPSQPARVSSAAIHYDAPSTEDK
ncbi:hypothetical protein IWQ55_000305 [Labrenzia sp. EL_208]|nr:hypothetical protein [Labrenzia sp. EL_132]MBG6227113.1 hypothetical protein [Labrenzia sp. EL_208]